MFSTPVRHLTDRDFAPGKIIVCWPHQEVNHRTRKGKGWLQPFRIVSESEPGSWSLQPVSRARLTRTERMEYDQQVETVTAERRSRVIQ